jgi:hypothetical protein
MALVENTDRAGVYRVLVDVFLEAPAGVSLAAIKGDFTFDSRERGEDIHAGSIYFQECRGGKMLPLASLCPVSAHSAVAEVMGFYLDAGLTIEEAFQPMPGHISLGFLFMSHLINTERLELQKKFWDVMQWVPACYEELMVSATSALLQGDRRDRRRRPHCRV